MADKPRMDLSPTQVIGGALAAASAAVVASLLGVYGTVAGAAIVSVVASLGGAVYTHSFRRGKQAIENRTGRIARLAKDGTPLETEGESGDAEAKTEANGATEEKQDGETGQQPGKRSWRSRLAGINPKAVAVTSVLVLALSLGGIVAAEQLLGKPISSALGRGDDQGGNSLTRLAGNDSPDSDRKEERSPKPTPTATVTETETPDEQQTEQPTEEPTQQPSSQPTTSKPTTSQPTAPPSTENEPTTGTSGGTSSDGSPDEGGGRLQAPGD